MSVFVEANPPEILRASQKDESYINTIKSELADIVQRLFGKQQTSFFSIGNSSSDLLICLPSCYCLNREPDMVEGPVAVRPLLCLPLLHLDHIT